MITARVSNVSAFARWRADEESDVAWLINNIRGGEESEQMRKGTAFHKFLEHAIAKETEIAKIDGYTFAFTVDASVYLPAMRETRRERDYGGIIVSGQVDAIEGPTIWDHKSTAYFDAASYTESWQWKFYLDLFDADRFVYNVWEMREMKDDPKAYCVYGFHPLTVYRYPSLRDDCTKLAHEYKSFAERYL